MANLVNADVNTEIDNLKQAVVKQVKAGLPVFFGCDVGQFSDRQAGIMDTALFEYEAAFDIKFGLSKADRLRTNESSMTHAMVISGVHLDAAGKPVRYKVENSWGDAVGDKGYFVMTDAWFEQFVYQVVIPKALAPKELAKVFEGREWTVLPPWDPMVSRWFFCWNVGWRLMRDAGLIGIISRSWCGCMLYIAYLYICTLEGKVSGCSNLAGEWIKTPNNKL